MFCDEEETKAHLKFPVKWQKVIKIPRQYVPWQCFYSLINVTLSCPCAHHEGIWERGGTTPHIINPALLHTMPSDNILPTTVSMLTFLLLHISLANKRYSWLIHSLYIWYPYFYGLLVFTITYPHSLALKGSLALHEYVLSLLLYPGENALSTNWTGGCMGQRFGLEAL